MPHAADSREQLLNRSTVMHVTQSHSGGVSRAIENIVTAAPWAEHHLLWAGDEAPGPVFDGRSTQISAAPGVAISQIRRGIGRLRPDVVHLHSSFAGASGRLAAVSTRAMVVYQPHCFAFEDRRRRRVTRATLWLAEYLLAHVRRTRQVCAVVGSREADLAAKLGNQRVVTVPNLPTVPTLGLRHASAGMDVCRVAMIGRIAPQKDPQFFAEVAREVRRRVGADIPVEFVWIGDGDPVSRGRLEAAGVRVTGWLDAEQVTNELDQASIYLHSANYEGYPIAVLDAAARSVPVVVRDIACFTHDDIAKVRNVDEAVQYLVAVAQGGSADSRTVHVPHRSDLELILRGLYT